MKKIIQNETEVILHEINEDTYEMNWKGNKVTDNAVKSVPIIRDYIFDMKREAKEKFEPHKTGIDDLDKIIGGGLTPGLYVFGANPGLGKTTLALNILINLALNKVHSVMFNLEMSNKQIITKVLASLSYSGSLKNGSVKYNLTELYSSKLYDSNTDTFKKDFKILFKYYLENIHNYITFITYSTSNNCRNIEDIEMSLHNFRKFHHIKPVVLIDFLQLLGVKNINKEFETRREELDFIIEKLKKLSTEYEVPIIVISSLSRSGYTKEEDEEIDFEYSLSVFKETGHIEYTADFIALLTKGKTESKFGEKGNEVININVLKNRYGKAGYKIPLTFISEYAYFITNKPTK